MYTFKSETAYSVETKKSGITELNRIDFLYIYFLKASLV